MASGTINVTTSNPYIAGKIQWNATTNVNENTSTINATLSLSRTNTGYTTKAKGSFTIYIGGESRINSPKEAFVITYNSNTSMTSISGVKFKHNSDGTGSVKIGARGSMPGIEFTMADQSQTIRLDTIPRATTPVFSDTAYAGKSYSISLPRASANFTHKVTYTMGSASGTISDSAGTGVVWEIPLNLCQQMPNAASGMCNISVVTYHGNTVIGTVKKDLKIQVPNTVIPSVNQIKIQDMVSNPYGVFLQGHSKVQVTIDATGNMKSGIQQYEMLYNGTKVQNASNVLLSGVIQSAGKIDFDITVTDSRKRLGKESESIHVVPYFSPEISGTGIRCDASGEEILDGDCVKVSYRGRLAEVNQLSRCSIGIYYRPKGGTTWMSRMLSPAAGLEGEVLFSDIDPDKSYEFELRIADEMHSRVYMFEIAVGAPTIDFMMEGRGIGIGTVSTWEGLDVNMPCRFRKPIEIEGDLKVKGRFQNVPVPVPEAVQIQSGTVSKKSVFLFNGKIDVYINFSNIALPSGKVKIGTVDANYLPNGGHTIIGNGIVTEASSKSFKPAVVYIDANGYIYTILSSSCSGEAVFGISYYIKL